jgi:hypothetical protein
MVVGGVTPAFLSVRLAIGRCCCAGPGSRQLTWRPTSDEASLKRLTVPDGCMSMRRLAMVVDLTVADQPPAWTHPIRSGVHS